MDRAEVARGVRAVEVEATGMGVGADVLRAHGKVVRVAHHDQDVAPVAQVTQVEAAAGIGRRGGRHPAQLVRMRRADQRGPGALR